MKWKCLRCKVVFDEKLIKKPGCPCDCFVKGFDSPSPWEPVPQFRSSPLRLFAFGLTATLIFGFEKIKRKLGIKSKFKF